MKSLLSDHHSTLLGRCVTLRRPDVALKILTQRNKYGLDLPDLTSARDLLHTIFVRAVKPTPFDLSLDAEAKPFTASHHDDALLLAALYPPFRLGEVSQDPISSALLISMFTLAPPAGQDTTAKTLAKDLLTMVKTRKARTLDAKDDPHRQQVWLRHEVSKPSVKTFLSSQGFKGDLLARVGYPTTQAHV